MDWISALSLAASLSLDAATVGAADGISESSMRVSKIFLIALCFGVFQALMPAIGYFVGFAFQEVLSKWIPWIAFGLLTALAIKSVITIIRVPDTGISEDLPKRKLSWSSVIMQGVATSIDALCVGFALLSYSIPNALLTFMVIGIVTFALSALTIFLGKFLGSKLSFLGYAAPFISACVFWVLALKILYEGLFA